MAILNCHMIHSDDSSNTIKEMKKILQLKKANKMEKHYLLDPDEHESISERINDFATNAGLDDSQRNALMDIIDDYSEDHDKGEGADQEDKATTPAEPANYQRRTVPIVPQYAKHVAPRAAEDWLKSRESVRAFGRFLLRGNNDMRKNAYDFNQYAAKRMGVDLQTYNGGHYAASIDATTVANLIVPQPVADIINDAIADNTSGLYQMMNHTQFIHGHRVIINTQDLDNNGGGNGYPLEDYGTAKTQMATTLIDRFLRPGCIYEYMTVDHGILLETSDTDAVLDFILKKLPPRLISSIEKQSMFGTNTKMSSVRGVLSDATDSVGSGWNGQLFAHSVTATTAGVLSWDDLYDANMLVNAPGEHVLVTSRQNLGNLIKSLNQSNQILGAQALNPETVASALGVDKVITPYWWKASDNTNMLAAIIVPSAYEIVGQTGIESYTNFALQTNTDEYLQEMFIGGGLDTLDSAAVILPGASS